MIGTARCGRLDLDELDIEHEHALRPTGRIFVRELRGDPEPVLVANRHQRDAIGPARDDGLEVELCRLLARHVRIEHAAIRGPAGVVDLHDLVRLRLRATLAGLEHLVERALRGLARIAGRLRDIRRRGRRRDAGLDRDDLDLVADRSRRGPRRGLAVRRHFLAGAPHAHALAGGHAREHLLEGRRLAIRRDLRRPLLHLGGLVHPPRRIPRGVVVRDGVVEVRLVRAGARAHHDEARAALGGLGSRRRRGDIGWHQGSRPNLDDLHLVDERLGGTLVIVLVADRRRHPQDRLLAGLQELHRFGEAGRRGREVQHHRLTARLVREERLAGRRLPAGVVHHHDVVALRRSARRVRDELLVDEARGRLHRIRGRVLEIRGGRNLLDLGHGTAAKLRWHGRRIRLLVVALLAPAQEGHCDECSETTHMRGEHTAGGSRTLGAERLARQIADTGGLHEDVVLDPDAAERAQLLDRLPVDQRARRALAEWAEEAGDEVQPGLDREHLTCLDLGGVPQELVLRPRRPLLHAHVVHRHAERVAQAVREECPRDAAHDQLVEARLTDSSLDQQLREHPVRLVVKALVLGAGLDLRDDRLLELVEPRDQRAKPVRGRTLAARVRARDVAAVALTLRTRVDEHRGRPRDLRALIRDVVQDRAVLAKGDDVLVRRGRIVLLRREQVREVELELRARPLEKPLLDRAMTDHRAPRGLGEALDLVRALGRADEIERAHQRARVDLARRRLAGIARDHRDLAARQHIAGVPRADGHHIERVPEVVALGRRRGLPVIVDDGSHEGRLAAGAHDHECIRLGERTPVRVRRRRR